MGRGEGEEGGGRGEGVYEEKGNRVKLQKYMFHETCDSIRTGTVHMYVHV